MAAEKNQPSLFEKIVKNKMADVNAKNALGKTALEIASELSNDESFATLIAYGANATSQQCNAGKMFYVF